MPFQWLWFLKLNIKKQFCKLRCRLGNTSNDSMFNANNIDADLCISIDYVFVSYCFVIGVYVTTKDKASSFLLFTKCFCWMANRIQWG